ncbi:MAG: MurR/RpiR family transcriptional regulator [Coriobacteriales bacterium]|jgi:RpiR family glv operon transcriptional regulator|nr:MurR/RpiR family transcriptional regulator [Coriobacteriales bacterium]
MARDFFEATQGALERLNQTERKLFDYVVKHMDSVKDLSIQRFAAERYLSTTTIFRFTQKLGFTGYSDFINSLLVTEHRSHTANVPLVLRSKAYADEYLKNVMEAVRVMPAQKIAQVLEVLARKPNVYILCDSDANDLGRYCEKLFLGLGRRTYFPEVAYQVVALMDLVENDDLLIVLSYSGEEPALIETVERLLYDKRPFLLSITRADNNTIQNMSDVNFYMFADEIELNGINLTSQLAMLMVLELLVYESLDAE